MSSVQISIWVALAVLLFWSIGAYNRLVGLRNALVRSFGPVDAELSERHALLDQQIEAVAGVLAHATERVDALRAAHRQAEAARLNAWAHPGAPGAIRSLRLACDLLAETRARLPVPAAGGVAMTDLNARLAESDTALGFARRQFNAAVLEYNHAVGQIPTRLVAAVFQFEPAGIW
jgi:LemA protein